MGHNEFIYADDMVEPFDPEPTLALLAGRLHRASALYRLMERGLDRARSFLPRQRVRRYSTRTYVRATGHRERARRIVDAYAERLAEVVTLARSTGTRLVFSELVANHTWAVDDDDVLFDCFSRGLPAATISRIRAGYPEALALQRAGRIAEALQRYLALEALDPSYQPILVRISQCLAAVGRRAEALDYSYRAQARSAFPSVATPEMARLLRRTCRETGTPLAAPIEALDRIFLDGPEVYERIFLDDCHPNGDGHRLIAEHIVAALEAAGVIPLLAPTTRAPTSR
jgi:hypothetical protein